MIFLLASVVLTNIHTGYNDFCLSCGNPFFFELTQEVMVRWGWPWDVGLAFGCGFPSSSAAHSFCYLLWHRLGFDHLFNHSVNMNISFEMFYGKESCIREEAVRVTRVEKCFLDICVLRGWGLWPWGCWSLRWRLWWLWRLRMKIWLNQVLKETDEVEARAQMRALSLGMKTVHLLCAYICKCTVIQRLEVGFLFKDGKYISRHRFKLFFYFH